MYRLFAAAAAVASTTVIAACGSTSGSSPSAVGSGSTGQPTHAQMQQDAVRFSGCMRLHGVPNFPDATDPRAFKVALDPNSVNAHSPAFQSAYTACRHLLPNDGVPPNQEAPHTQAQIGALLAFARCLRSHGFPDFPDPNSSGQLTHEMLASAEINLHQPAVLQAADACTGVTHGLITKSVVDRFVPGH